MSEPESEVLEKIISGKYSGCPCRLQATLAIINRVYFECVCKFCGSHTVVKPGSSRVDAPQKGADHE
jgi:hypothetical protein